MYFLSTVIAVNIFLTFMGSDFGVNIFYKVIYAPVYFFKLTDNC